MADKVEGRRKRGKPAKRPSKFPGIPLSDAALNALREKADREESGLPDPGKVFLEHQQKQRRDKERRMLRAIQLKQKERNV